MKQTAKKKKYKMVVYQRDLSRYYSHCRLFRRCMQLPLNFYEHYRKLANQDEAINAIRAKLGDVDWDIEVLSLFYS